jgi:hypothetical protein
MKHSVTSLFVTVLLQLCVCAFLISDLTDNKNWVSIGYLQYLFFTLQICIHVLKLLKLEIKYKTRNVTGTIWFSYTTIFGSLNIMVYYAAMSKWYCDDSYKRQNISCRAKRSDRLCSLARHLTSLSVLWHWCHSHKLVQVMQTYILWDNINLDLPSVSLPYI